MRAFTLIEVLIALYIAVLGVGVFYEVVYNQKKILKLQEERNSFYLKASFLDKDFNITNDKILRVLNREKFTVLKRKKSFENLPFYIEKIIIFNKTNRVTLYKLGLK